MKRFVDNWCDFLAVFGSATLFIPGMFIGFIIECLRPGIETGKEIFKDTLK